MQTVPKQEPELREPTLSVPRPHARTTSELNYLQRRNWLLTVVFDLLLCLPLVALICFYDLNSPSINYRDETTHIRAVQAMHQSGDWWTPIVRGQPYYNKPPFKMWLTFLPLEVFGESAFAYRFLDALAGVLTCMLLYFFARFSFRSRVAGIAAALLLIGCESYVFGHGVRKAVQDSMLIFLCTLGTILGWLWLQSLDLSGKNERRPEDIRRTSLLALGGGIAIGLAILTKSVAGLLPFIIFGCYLVASRQLIPVFTRHKASLALVLGSTVIIAGAYFVPHFLFTPGFFGTIIGQEVIERATEGYHNQSKLWFYFERLFSDRQAIPPELLAISFCYFLYCWFRKRSELHLLLALWSSVPLVLFTIIPSRLTWYISPSFPGMALMGAGTIAAALAWLTPRLRDWWHGESTLGPISALVGIFLALSAATGGGHLLAIATALRHLEPRSATDRLVTDIVHYGKLHPGHGGVIRLDAPEYALHESTYGGMIDPVTASAETVDDALRLYETGKYAFFFSNMSSFYEMAKRKGITGYRYFPPMYDRTQWMIGFTIDPAVRIPSLTPGRRLIKFQGAKSRVHFGLLPVEEDSQNRRTVEGPRVGIPLQGDSAMKTFGTLFAVNMSSRHDDAMRVEFVLNDHSLAQFDFGRSDFRTYRFQVPPGEWENGTNVLYMRFTSLTEKRITEDSNPVLLNWLSVRLPDPDAQAADSGKSPATDK